jgi:hypothetical protein
MQKWVTDEILFKGGPDENHRTKSSGPFVYPVWIM